MVTVPDGFEFLGDHAALDFINTCEGRGSYADDRLGSPEATRAWLQRAGLIPETSFGVWPPDARILWDEARRLREAILAVVERFSRGAPVAEQDLTVLNRTLAKAVSTRRIESGDGGYALRERALPGGPASCLAPLALAAAELLADGDSRRVRRCAGPECGLWFYDTSRNGSRRWCSMDRCGNRAKVAAHYRRKKAASTPRSFS